MTTVPDQSTAIVLMGENEAREAIKSIRLQMENSLSSLDRAIALTRQFEEQEGWKALGYRSLAACLSFELQVTRQRAGDLIDRMRASVLIEERTGEARVPSRGEARRELGKAPARRDESDAPASESDHLPDDRSEPITRERIGGGNVSIDYGFDEGEAVYRCRHCQRIGTTEQLAHCLEVVREQGGEF